MDMGAVVSDASRGGGIVFPGTSSMAAMSGMWDGANTASASGMSPPLSWYNSLVDSGGAKLANPGYNGDRMGERDGGQD